MHFLQVVGVAIAVCHHRHLEIVVFLLELILRFVNIFKLLPEGDLHGVLLDEGDELLLAQLEVLLNQALHVEERLAECLEVLHGIRRGRVGDTRH